MSDPEIRPPVPPFKQATARQKVQAAEDASNTCDPERVALAYTIDSDWRNRDASIDDYEIEQRERRLHVDR